jgi:hypothetical protein
MTSRIWEQDLIIHAMAKPLATPLYQLLLQTDATLLIVIDGGVYKNKRLWHIRLALTRKSYGSAKASHEVAKCSLTEPKGIMVRTSYSCFWLITVTPWKFNHLKIPMHRFLLQ